MFTSHLIAITANTKQRQISSALIGTAKIQPSIRVLLLGYASSCVDLSRSSFCVWFGWVLRCFMNSKSKALLPLKRWDNMKIEEWKWGRGDSFQPIELKWADCANGLVPVPVRSARLSHFLPNFKRLYLLHPGSVSDDPIHHFDRLGTLYPNKISTYPNSSIYKNSLSKNIISFAHYAHTDYVKNAGRYMWV